MNLTDAYNQNPGSSTPVVSSQDQSSVKATVMEDQPVSIFFMRLRFAADQNLSYKRRVQEKFAAVYSEQELKEESGRRGPSQESAIHYLQPRAPGRAAVSVQQVIN